MRKELELQLHSLLYEQQKNEQTFNEIHEIYQMTAKFLQNYPFQKYPFRGYEAFRYICDRLEFDSVLDVGCGEGLQSAAFLKEGKKVTAIDYSQSARISDIQNENNFKLIIGDINNYEFEQKFDCVWASHVLEHQLNPQGFLKKILSVCREGGGIAITVPPYKSEIVSGHVCLWNAGLLLYRLVLAGCDCKDAHVKKYGYNVSVVVTKKTINVLDDIKYDVGDLKIIREYFPKELEFRDDFLGRDILFEGNISKLNWL